MGLDDLVHDALPVNPAYEGMVAEAYDVWMPPTGTDTDVAVYARAIRAAGGPALELGCGTGRVLVPLARDGLAVEGVDASADMLAICARHAADEGLDVVLHRADWRALDLGREYAVLYNPAGSFALLDGDDEATAALTSWRRHLAPGGSLLVAAGVPTADAGANYEWRLRRSATRPADGVTFMVHEAVHLDADHQVQHILNRNEAWSATGELLATSMRRFRLRWWTQSQLEALLLGCGYVEVEFHGDEDAFMVVARAAATRGLAAAPARAPV